MPQMMPLSWLTLFAMFASTLILFSVMNYYSYPQKTKNTQSEGIQTTNMNWKW
uniref:ATP synthase complex subunit 8 n=1 Tax=Kalotermes sp. TaxID=2942757 RepID=A0A8X8M1M1_9NEOP|nr:ATP synthase F0 subunit 8 [Kalotermes sp.]